MATHNSFLIPYGLYLFVLYLGLMTKHQDGSIIGSSSL